jgi:hypothetical protein
VPTHLRLDNGTNFVAGKKDLSGLWEYVSKSYVKAKKPDKVRFHTSILTITEWTDIKDGRIG